MYVAAFLFYHFIDRSTRSKFEREIKAIFSAPPSNPQLVSFDVQIRWESKRDREKVCNVDRNQGCYQLHVIKKFDPQLKNKFP